MLPGRNRFAAKIMFAFVIVILIPTLFASASFYMVANSTVKNNVRESSVLMVKQAAETVSFMMNVGSDTSDLIFSDLRIQSIVKNSASARSDLREWRENEEYIRGFLNTLVYTSSFTPIIYVIKDQEHSWGSGAFSKVKLSRYAIEELDWARQAREADGGLVWLELQDDRFSGAGDNTKLVLPIARVLKDFDTMENIGYLLVNLNGQKMIEYTKQLKLGDTGEFFVVNEEGQVMIHPDPNRIRQVVRNEELLQHIVASDYIEFEFMQGKVPYYGVKQRLSNGWYMVGIVPTHEITQRLDQLNVNIMWSFGLFTLLGLLIGFVIAGRVLKPINQLTRQMREVQQGDFTVRTEVVSNDELGLMSRQFNKMIVEIRRLMEQLTTEHEKKKEAEIRALNHRIHPHFLYNTLATLRWLMKYGQMAKAEEGMSALIRLLEANMGKKGSFITISEELDIIEKYLKILELRYNQQFRLHLNVEEGAARFRIPRMLIQPLVENAIFHGIVPNASDGDLWIEGKQEGEAVILLVRDNGIGILPEKQIVQHSVAKAVLAGETGIGLRHVYESIALYFGPGSNVTLLSAEGEGTTVKMVLIPKFEERRGEA